MSEPTLFEPFQKIARLNREIVITEKIDGTNAQIFIDDDRVTIRAGSRNRWLTPEADNFGFARWVEANKEELLHLGPGRHFGEWFGEGIQRGYGLKEKRFYLFNIHRYEKNPPPSCCGIVPVLYRGLFSTIGIESVLRDLSLNGSQAAPGFMDPEGIVVFHTAAKTLFKVTLKDDEKPKGQVE